LEPVSILMLEDSVLDADLTLSRLTKAGLPFTATRVDTRAAFEAAVTNGRYDIILSDYALPDFDGLRALEFAKQHCPDTPFIIVSGVLGEEVAIEALHLGATDYVLKTRMGRLAPSVERAINESRSRTQRQRSEAELRRLQELSRRILESTRDCIMTMDPSGSLISVNPSCAVSFELPVNAGGRKWLDLWREGDRATAAAAFETASRGGAQSFEALSVGAERRWWNVLITAVSDASGAPEQIVSVARDVTERRRAEEERQILLAREKQARADAEEKARQLQQSIEDLEHFAYVASHDLKEPLRVVTMYSQLLLRRYAHLVDAEAQSWVRHIEGGTRRMIALLGDVLSYSKVVHSDDEFEVVDLDSVVEEAIRNCSVAIEESGAHVERDPLPAVPGHRGQLLQLMQNLIGNAIKYKAESAPVVNVSAERQDGHWLISVRDNGAGFDSKYSEKIFGIFKRLHGNDYPGTGIGLAICRRVVERHHGKIWAESEPGRGSTFRFTLPVAAQQVSGNSGRQLPVKA
jgi:PAS domain S-box-containing protein